MLQTLLRKGSKFLSTLQRDAERAKLVFELNKHHAALFGRTNKSLDLKIKDLKTQEVLDKISLTDESLLEAMHFNKVLHDYFEVYPFAIKDFSTPQHFLQVLEKFAPIIMSRWNDLYDNKQEAMEDIELRREILRKLITFQKQIQQEEQNPDLSEEQRIQKQETRTSIINELDEDKKFLKIKLERKSYANFPAYVQMLANIARGAAPIDYFHTVSLDITVELLDAHIINNDEAALIRSLLSYLDYNCRGRKLLELLPQETQHVESGPCSYYGHEIDLDRADKAIQQLIHRMELACSVQDSPDTVIPIYHEYNEYDDLIVENISISSLPDVLTDKDFNSIMTDIGSQMDGYRGFPLKFTIQDQAGYDMGGVTRMVMYKLGEYLSTTLKKVNGLHYLCYEDGTPLKDKFLKHMATFFMLVMITGTKVDLPLSFGIVFALAKGNKSKILKAPGLMPLETLMALFRREDPEELKALINTLNMTDAELAEILPDYPQSSQVPQGTEYKSSNKLAWLYSVLFKKLFYPYSANTSPLVKVINMLPDFWYSYSSMRATEYSVSMIAELFKVPLTLEIISAIPVVSEFDDEHAESITRNIEFLKRFLRTHPELWEKTLVYIHGSLRTDKEITIRHSFSGLPVAHTCFGSMDVRPYDTYEQFEREFIYAMENTSGLHLA